MGHSGSYGPQPGIESSPHSVEVQGLTTDGPGTTFSTPVSFGKHKMGFSTLMAFTGCNRQCKAGFYFYLFFIFLFIFIYFLVLPVFCYQPISLHPRAHTISHVIPWTFPGKNNGVGCHFLLHTPAFLPGESRRQRSLAGYSPWGSQTVKLLKPLSMHMD